MQAAGDLRGAGQAWVRHSAFDHPSPSHEDFVRGLMLGCAVEVLVPGGSTWGGEAWEGLGGGASHFYAVEVPLGEITSPGFIDHHLKSGGEFCAVACCMPGDRRGAAAVTPDGHLHLSVPREDYERLGLVGTGAGGDPKEWYEIDVKLTAEGFKPGERFYNRVAECAARTAPLQVLCGFARGGVAEAVHLPGAEPGGRRELRYRRRTVEGVTPPPLPGGGGRGAADGLDHQAAEAVLEWVGAVSCGAHGRVAGTEGMAGAVGVPGPFCWAGEGEEEGEVEVHRWEGLVAPWHVGRALALARRRVEEEGAPWAAVTWAGAADVPDGARGPRGAREACILLLGGGEYLLFAVG